MTPVLEEKEKPPLVDPFIFSTPQPVMRVEMAKWLVRSSDPRSARVLMTVVTFLGTAPLSTFPLIFWFVRRSADGYQRKSPPFKKPQEAIPKMLASVVQGTYVEVNFGALDQEHQTWLASFFGK